MARRMPLTIDAEETICLAVQLRAAKSGVSSSDVVNAILRAALTAELAEAASVPTLVAVIQDLHVRCRTRLVYGSQRLVSSPGKLKKG